MVHCTVCRVWCKLRAGIASSLKCSDMQLSPEDESHHAGSAAVLIDELLAYLHVAQKGHMSV
jgi:hypothetical protein